MVALVHRRKLLKQLKKKRSERLKAARSQQAQPPRQDGVTGTPGATSIFLATAILVFPFRTQAAEPTPEQLQFFENKVRPILSDNCYQCHSTQAKKVKAGLWLDSREGVQKGGDNGPVVVLGDPDKSVLITAVKYTDPDLKMPPDDKKLTDAQIADLIAWVQMGAPDPRVATVAQKAWTDKAHWWAWQPLTKPEVPDVKESSWVQTPIDNFILAKLEERGLKPNPSANKRALIRRATFDLIGLPPTPEEVENFVNDESPDAFAKVVDRLLASPHYGERWGRHWLDVARYSDTKGQVRRQREDEAYPYAWTYRDYVIRSFNDDKPYNVFIVEQLAADKVPATAHNPTNLTALGFLTVGDRFMEMPNDIYNDRIDVVTKGFLGLTVSCARCHDHKFDPIPTKDYYSLRGIFASCVEPKVEPVVSKIYDTPAYEDYYKKRNGLEAEKDLLQTKLRQMRGKRDPAVVRPIQRALRENETKTADLELTHPAAPTRAMVLVDGPRQVNSPVFLRGDPGNKGPIVPRRFLEVLSGQVRPEFTNGSGRLELAWGIISKSNPMTPRVMLNRIWMHHFGQGFVPTPDDFGTMSTPPSHPELLDYLASRFVEEGWSIKKIHRLIMLSSVYQQSCESNPRYAQIDPNNRLLWRANIRRLEFEALRDSLLAIGGTLDPTMYGRPVDLDKEPFSTRRTVYGFIDRSDMADVLINFDFASPDLPTGRRHETTVPQQALFLMNSPLVVEQAKKLVTITNFAECEDDTARIKFLYERIYQRPPRQEEISLGLDFIGQTPTPEETTGQDDAIQRISNTGDNFRPQQFAQKQGKKRGGATPFRKRKPLTVWEEYAHALLQANETSFVN
jgi:hypothetical protein